MGIVLTNNAKFTPYTFDEMLKPLAMATLEYRAIEEGIAELGSKSDLMRRYASEEPDADWSKKYNEYANTLDKLAEDLAKYGLNPKSRQGLLNLKRQYGDTVTPIEEAIAARKEAYKYRDTIKAKDNSAVFTNPNLTISDFMNGKAGDNTYISGKELMERIASNAKIAGLELFNYYISEGKNADEAAALVWEEYVDDPNTSPLITKEFERLGINNLRKEDQEKLRQYARAGTMYASSEIAKGEYLNAKERRTLALQEAQYQRQLSKMDLEMAEAGYMKTSNNQYKPDPKRIDIWEVNDAGEVVGKKAKSNNKDTSKILTYHDTMTYKGDTGERVVGLKTGESIKGERVDIEAEGDDYIVKIDGIELGRYNPTNKEFISSVDDGMTQDEILALNTALGGKKYNKDQDDANLRKLLVDAVDLVKTSGIGALKSHKFYFEPSKAGMLWGYDHKGSYTIDPLNREAKSTADTQEINANHNYY